ncbi:MAG: ABC transporter ATP-binding protein/permease [Clostridia bacterium]|nr:ABC transporter ATP-binding protein/permease [Clostridia bacterium]
MLQTVDLVKIYKPKKGVPVRALDGVSLTFPQQGMVFLLGKSGSGKSTLLNVLGGLDRYDGGEIRIKGVSSKDFKQSHFDSYRNTYVGFIFQEYNILEEFSVGANIALALQLQGKKPDDEIINDILRQVDLEGFGNRKPNELSGGQKQRVAIARALVKSPEIIMADEPTGALDSVTGKQVLETLKKLSKEKLVIIVSHDREFAETYADRIIELADGKVIDDVERSGEISEEIPEGLTFEDNTITVPGGYHLTEEDRIAINEYLAKGEGLKIVGGQKKKRFGFTKTNQEAIKQGGGAFRLIKSRLPFRFAFPMGASGLKHKKIRLVFTILLSCIAFGLFGLADTFASYDHIRTSTDSILDSNIRYASVEKTVAIKHDNGEIAYYDQVKLNQEDLDEIEAATGVSLEGVYLHNYDYPSFERNVGDAPKEGSLYETQAAGYVEVTEETVQSMGGTVVAGKLPDGTKNEIAISDFFYGLFAERGYYENTKDESTKLLTIQKYDDIIGKTVLLNEKEYTVTAVVDTGLDMERYKPLIEDQEGATEADMLVLYALRQEFRYAVGNSLAGTIMVGPGAVKSMEASHPVIYDEKDGTQPFTVKDGTVELWLYSWRFGKLSENTHLDILWLDGQPRTELGEKEIVIPAFMLEYNLSTEEPEKYLPSYIEKQETSDYTHLANLKLSRQFTSYENGEFVETYVDGYRIVGLIRGVDEEFLLMNDQYVNENTVQNGGIWDHAIGGMPERRGDVETLVTYCLQGTQDVVYELINPACYELNVVNEILQALSKIFLWIGVGFAVFASLLLSNFIGTSISYKKQEIGILRAIGSRGNDVFRIFFSESFLIAAVNFTLSAIGTGVVTAIINWVIRHETGLLITLLHFGIRQILLLFAVSIVIAAIASFIPVKKIAAKRPIDAIRDR